MSLCESRILSTILLILIKVLALARAQQQQENPSSCTSNGNYTSNGTYSANLNTLLTSLSANMSDQGFYTASLGQNESRVYALALCRADQTLDQCRSCVRPAARDVRQLCLNQRQGVVWYEYCMVRYSDDPMNQLQTGDRGRVLRNVFNVSNREQFTGDRATLLEDLQNQAGNGSSELKAGAGNRPTADSESQALYGLVQCTADLSSGDCVRCLTAAVQRLRICCDFSRGVRVLMRNCNLRHELYSFYNETRLRQLRVLLPPAPPPSPPGTNGENTRAVKKDDHTAKVVIIIVIPVAVCLIVAACAVIYMRKRKKRRSYEITETTDEISSVESLQYDFGKIREATGDFSDANKLGQGGFGAVYRGKLHTGEDIAVKRLSRDSGQGIAEFKNEVLLVAKLQHRNLVRLLGFSMEGNERALVYEFVQNSSLDKFIFDPTKSSLLDWEKRYKIIGGVAKGLLYLHEDSRLKIIHRDLKASNILLDAGMNPKIADFGMARLFRQDETQANTSKIVGTYGYMSPEYAMHGQFSIKSDVFSFGVLVLEIVTGQRNSCIQNGENVDDLLTLTWKNWREGTAASMVDPVLRNGVDSIREVLRCIHMGLLCVQENAADRPTMASVCLMLSDSTVILPVPSEPAFYMASEFGPFVPISDANSSDALKFKTGASEGSTQNDMSVTELYPR